MSTIAAIVLNLSNRSINRDAVAVLDPEPKDRVADIGFGGGAGLKELLKHPNLSVVGVEPSTEMIARMQRRLGSEDGLTGWNCGRAALNSSRL